MKTGSDVVRVRTRSRVIQMIVPLAVVTAMTSVASAQSFDCVAAATWAEKKICADAGLRGLDFTMARLFEDVFQTVPSGVERMLDRDQVAWRRRRDACRSLACLVASYRQRLEQLDALAVNVAPEDSCERMLVETGATSVTMSGVLEASCYLVRAKKGQRMVVRLTTPSPDLTFVVLDWQARQVLFDGRRGGNRTVWDGRLPTSGDYLIFVDYAHARTRGVSRHTVTVKATN